jgi:hypothetical protein
MNVNAQVHFNAQLPGEGNTEGTEGIRALPAPNGSRCSRVARPPGGE